MILNYIWIAFFVIGAIVAFVQAVGGNTAIFGEVMTGIFDSAKTGFEVALGLTGIMTFWLGIMKIGERGGVITLFSKLMSPFFEKLFPEIPKGHPASGSIMMNFSANMLGLDNAATPLGLKAMQELQEINTQKDTASNAMIMFLVLNTAGITIIPTSVIAMRQTLALEQGLQNFNAADIFLPTLMGTFVSFVSGMIAVAIYQRIPLWRWQILAFLMSFVGIMYGMYVWLSQYPPDIMGTYTGMLGSGIIFAIILLFIITAALRRVNVYEAFVEGAKEGFTTSIQIIPYLVAILVAISVFRTTGCMDYIVEGIGGLVSSMGMDNRFVPALPVGLMKTLSGSGARGLMVDVMKTYGVDSFQGKLAAIIQGSTETTFYVLAVYFGSINIKKTRYAAVCGLIADIVGLVGAILIGYMFFA